MRMEFGQNAHPRIAIYSQDGLGLGHMRRTNSIAYQVLQLRPDAGVITLSDLQLGQFFQTAQNHDYVKLPSIVKAGVGDWRAANLPFAFSDVLQLRTELIWGRCSTTGLTCCWWTTCRTGRWENSSQHWRR